MVLKKGWLVTGILALVLLFISKKNFYMMNVMKFFVDNFATGRSDFKVVLFFGFLSLLSFVLFIIVNFPHFPSKRVRSYIHTARYLPLLLFFLLLFGYLVGIGSYVYFLEKFDLGYNGYYWSVYDGKLSSTEFHHIHTSKAVLTRFSELFQMPMHQTYDEGLFYRHVIPEYFMDIFLVLIPLIFILILLCLLRLYEDLQTSHSVIFYVILFIISGLSSLKNMVDGGLFNAEALFWFSVFSVILFWMYLKKSFVSILFLKWVSYVTGGVYILVMPIYVLFWQNFSYLFGRYILFLSFLFWLFFMFKYVLEKDYLKLVVYLLGYILVVLLVALVFPNTYVHYVLDADLEMRVEVQEGSDAYLYVPDGVNLDLCGDVLYSQTDFSLCHFVVSENTTILHLLNKNSMLPVNYNPLLVDKVSCNVNSTKMDYGRIILIEGTVPDVIDTEIIGVNFTLVSAGNQTNYPKYDYTISYFGCTPSYYEVLYRTFNAYGIQAFIVY